VATRKDKDEASAAEPQVVLEQAGPAVPTFVDGVGEVDEKVNPAQDELQERVDEAERRGYLGVEVDPTPNRALHRRGRHVGSPDAGDRRGQRLMADQAPLTRTQNHQVPAVGTAGNDATTVLFQAPFACTVTW
jgi:hypothetical protein